MKTLLTRLKFILLIAITSMMILLHNLLLLLPLCFGLIFLSLILSPKANMKARLFPIGSVCLFVVLFQLIFNPTVTLSERFVIGVVASFRLMALSLTVFLFTETTSVSKIVAALSFLPRKYCLMMTISFALLPTLMRETQTIKLAQQARGLQTRNFNPLRTFLPIMIPLLHRTLIRAERIAITLETKGFDISL